jgi:hypothetical protein
MPTWNAEKPALRSMHAFLLWVLVMFPSSTWAGLIAFVESPEAGPVAGVQIVRGWAFATEPGETITRVDLVVDGEPVLAIPCCGARADVAAAHPQYPPAVTLQSGWGLTLNWSLLPPGSHIVQVEIATNQGTVWTSEPRTVEVLTLGGFEFVDQLTLADAAARLDGDEIVLDGVQVRDQVSGQEQALTLRLRWDLAAQSLAVSGVVTTATVTSLRSTLRGLLSPVWTWLARTTSMGAVHAVTGIHAHWESPSEGQVAAGIGVLRGWMFADEHGVAITSVQVLLDGVTVTTLPCCSARGDVAAAFPDNPNALQSGAGLVLNYGELRAGPHTLGLEIAAANGAALTLSRAVLVLKPGGFSFLDLFDLADASVHIAGEELVLEDVRVRDKASQLERTVSLRFRWDESAQAFILAANDPPVAHDQHVQTNIDQPVSLVLIATDADGDPVRYEVVDPPSHGVLMGAPPNVIYTPVVGFTGQDRFTFRAHDFVSPSNVATVTITVAATVTSVPPVVDLDPTNSTGQRPNFVTTFTEDDGPVLIVSPVMTVADPDSATLVSATLTLTNPLDAGREVLAVDPAMVAPNTPIVAAYDALSGVLSLSGSASVAAYQAALRTLTYDNASQNPNPTPRIITVLASDGAAVSAPVTSTVNVQPVNDQPTFTASDPPAVGENAGPQTIPGWATFDPGAPEEAGQMVVAYTVSAVSNPGLFSVLPAVATNGTLTYTPAPNTVGTSTFTVTVQDDGGTANGGVDTSAPQTFTITINAVNSAPSFTVGPDQTVLEDAGPQTVAGWATAITDGDDGDQTLTFNVTNNTNPGLFSAGPAVNATTGDLTYTPAADANGTATITLTLSDDGGTDNGGQDTSPPQTFTITVTAVNDAPSFTSGGDQTVLEDAGPQTVNPWATGISAGPANESEQTLAFIITNNTNPGLFSAGPSVSATGVLTYTPVADAFGSATITVVLMDDGGTANGGVDTSAPQTFTITVVAVDDPPVAVDDAATITEDDPATTIDVLANDTDVDGGPISIASVTQPANGVVVITNGGADVTYQPDPDYCNTPPGTTLDTFTYTLAPGGSTATVSVTVTCVNDVPVVDLDGTADDPGGDIDFAATFTEGTPAVIVDANNLTVSDVDNSTLASATITLTNLQDTGLETLTATTTGTAITATYVEPVLTLTGVDTLAHYQQVLRTVTYNNTSQNPNTTARLIEFVVNDGTVDSAVATSTVTVRAVNSAPSFTKGADQTVLEDAGPQTVNGWAMNIEDGDSGGQTLTFNITGNTDPTLFSAGPAISATGVLTYTPAADANGSATITITLSDDGGTDNGGQDTSPPQTFTITVTAVNDAPSFTAGPNQTVNEDVGPQTVNPWATGISAGPANESGQILTFNITNNTNPGLFSAGPAISATGVLTYTPAADANGSATITITLSDDGGADNGGVDTSAPQMFTITVVAVNDAPSFTVGPNQTVDEDAGPQTVDPWATNVSAGPANESGQMLTFNITGNTNPGLFSAGPSINAAGVLTYTPAPDAFGSATITIQLMDDGGTANGGVDTTAPQSFTITVNPVNDPPTAVNQTYTAQANMQRTITADSGLLVGATDVESGTTLTVGTVSATTPAGGTVTVNPTTGAFDFDPPPGVTGDVTFTYEVCDDGIPGPGLCSAPATVTVTVAGPVIWFVQQGAAGSNDGRLSNPFTALGSVPGVDSANDRVFLFTGTYSDGLTLLMGEQLIGQGVTGASFDSVFGISPPSGTLARPAINGTRPTVQNTITLNTDAVVRGLDVSTTKVTALTDPVEVVTGVTVEEVAVSATNATAVSFGALNNTGASGVITLDSVTSTGGINNVTLTNVGRTISLGSGALSGASGTAFNVIGGTGTISYSGSITNTGAARLVNIVNKSSGGVTLAGNLSGTGSSTGINVQNNTTSGTIAFTGGSKVLTTGANAAVTLDNNDNATINFSGGGLAITTTSGAGFNAINGATAINVSGAGNTITSTTGTALNVNNSTIGGLGLTFQSISANGAASGIVLNTTGVLGGLTVTGDGGGSNNGSGGTIQNTTSTGVMLDNVGNVSLNYMNITNPGTDGIRATTLTNGLTVNRSNISDSSGMAPADKGIDIGDFSTGTPVSGTINITNTVIGPASGSSPHDSLAIGISSGTSTWNVTNTTFRNTGNSGINMELRGSSVVTAFTVTGSTFTGAGSATSARGIFVNTLDDSVMTLMTIDANTFTNNNIHIDLNQQNDTDPVGSHTFEILDNTTMTGANSHAINIFAAAGSFGGAFTGRIEGNTIGNSGVAGSGSAIGNGIRVNINGGSNATMLLDDNIIRQTPNGRGIEIIARNGTGGLDVTVTNNDVNPQAVSDPLAAILVQSNCLTVCNTVRSDVRNNTVPSATDVTDLLTTYIALVESSTSTLELVDTTAPITGTCASELAATNTGSTGVLGGCALITGPINTPP